MKILLGSHCFWPSTGGIETVSELLAREFTDRGHSIRVVTQTAARDHKFPFEVVRRPGAADLFAQVRWCDVFLQNNISLQTIWPAFTIQRPLFVIHQTWIRRVDNRVGWNERLKLLALRGVRSIAISEAIASALPVPAEIIGNPYDDSIFNLREPSERERELIFVGRLVSDKGADLLLEALAKLRDQGSQPQLTVVGEGPERPELEAQAARLRLSDQVRFVGKREAAEIAELLNAHRVLVVPSRWAEPFGIVALEGIACGCAVVGSAEGGLKEAIGRCGATFPNGDAEALAHRLLEMLREPEQTARFREAAGAHLARFRKGRVAETYLELMKTALR